MHSGKNIYVYQKYYVISKAVVHITIGIIMDIIIQLSTSILIVKIITYDFFFYKIQDTYEKIRFVRTLKYTEIKFIKFLFFVRHMF